MLLLHGRYIRRAVYLPWGAFFPLHGVLAVLEQYTRRWLRSHEQYGHAHAGNLHGPHGAPHHQHVHQKRSTEARMAHALSHMLQHEAVQRLLTLGVLHATACWGFYGALEDPVLVKRVRRALCASLPQGAASNYSSIQQLCAGVTIGACRKAV